MELFNNTGHSPLSPTSTPQTNVCHCLAGVPLFIPPCSVQRPKAHIYTSGSVFNAPVRRNYCPPCIQMVKWEPGPFIVLYSLSLYLLISIHSQKNRFLSYRNISRSHIFYDSLYLFEHWTIRCSFEHILYFSLILKYSFLFSSQFLFLLPVPIRLI